MIAALVVTALGFDLRSAAPAGALNCPIAESSCDPKAPVAAKRAKDSADGWLDEIGLGSLEDLPWETLPLALGLSALIGAAGGLVYSGLVGARHGRGDDSSRS